MNSETFPVAFFPLILFVFLNNIGAVLRSVNTKNVFAALFYRFMGMFVFFRSKKSFTWNLRAVLYGRTLYNGMKGKALFFFKK